MVARGTTLVATFAFTVVVGRAIGAESAGNYFAWFAVVTAVGMVGRVGSDTFALKHAAPGSERRLPWRWLRRRVLYGTGALALCLSAIVPAAYSLHPHSTNDVLATVILVWSMPFTSQAIVDSAILRAAGRASLGAFCEMGLVQIVAIPVVLVAGFVGGVNYLECTAAYTGSAVVTMMLARLLTRPLLGEDYLPDLVQRKSWNMEMLHMMSASALFYLITWLPVVALWLASSSTQAAYFAASNRITSLLPLVTTIQMTATLPIIATLVRDKRTREASAVLRNLSLQASAFCIPIAILLAVWPGKLLSIFGPTFRPAAAALQIMGPAQSLVVVVGPVSLVMVVAGLERQAMIFGGVAIAVGFPALLVTSSELGAVGAAVADASLQGVFAVASAFSLYRTGVATSVFTPPIRRVRALQESI